MIGMTLDAWLETLGPELGDAREVLFHLTGEPVLLKELPDDPWRCPNCGLPVANIKSPYCGECCKGQAAFVRQMRTGLREGKLDDLERQVSLAQVLWQILGGGYPLRRLLVPEKTVQKVIARDGGLCGECGGPASTIDHIRTACNRPINLRAVCEACCRDKPFGDRGVIENLDFSKLASILTTRIRSAAPLRPCDDAHTWDWRAYVKARG